MYDVVVIGAGNSGICTATALSQSGLKVLVLESHNLPGGCATGFVRGRFEFDASLHGLDFDNFKPVFVDQMHLETEFPLPPHNFQYITVENGKVIRDNYDFSKDVSSQIENRFPGSGKIFSDVLKKIIDTQDAFNFMINPPKNDFTKKHPKLANMTHMFNMLTKHTIFFKEGQKTLEEVFDKYQVNDYLRGLLGCYWWYLGANSTDTPLFLYSVVSEFKKPNNYVKGTAHSYMAEIEKLIRENGGDIWFNTSATKINVKNNHVSSIETSQGEIIDTKYVVSAIDPRISVGKLLEGADDFKEEVMIRENDFDENFSFIMIYVGLDCSIQDLSLDAPHYFINESNTVTKSYKASFSLNGPKTIGVMIPNVIIPDASPEGTCIMSFSVPIQGSAFENLTQKEYIKVKHSLEKEIIEKVEKYLNIDLKSHIEEIETATPVTFARYGNLVNGALGNYMSGKQTNNVIKLTTKLNDSVEGLKFIGQFTGNLGYTNALNGYEFGLNLSDEIKRGKK